MSSAETLLMHPRRGLWVVMDRFKRSKAGVIGVVIVIILICTAILAPKLAPYDPNSVTRDRLEPPSSTHFFGTDNVGKDVFSGAVYGARISLTVGILAASSSMLLGVLVGSLAGYYGGALDSFLMRLSELFQIMPRFFLALVVVAILGGGVGLTIAVIGIVSWPVTARIVRAEFLVLKEQEFVESARALGFHSRYIILSEILPNALPPAIVRGTLEIATAILIEASLSFFGLGYAGVASWGQMLNRAQSYLRAAWWLSVFPGGAIFIAVLAFNLVGDALNDALNPYLKER